LRLASLHDVEVKIEVATQQLHALDVEFDNRREAGEYRYSVEICRGGLHHVYRVIDPPPDGRYWGAQIGAVAHALRSSLEHLAWQLVIANQGSPNNSTHFPIYERKPDKGKELGVTGGVPSEALKIIEAAQPYNGTSGGKKLAAIHKLDVFDKHRELVVTAARVELASTSGPAPLPQNSIAFTRRPLTNDNVVAVVKYVDARSEADPNLSFIPYMTFGVGAPYRGEIVSGFMWELLAFIENDFVPRFHQWVPPTPRPMNLPSLTRSRIATANRVSAGEG
jgi:hypothetical protein